MITQKTAEKIWTCYREIAAGEKLLTDFEEIRKQNETRHDGLVRTLTDAFGRNRSLQLGVPSGNDGHRMFDVAPELAEACIRAHIANKRALLVSVNEQGRIEAVMDECQATEANA